MVDDIVPGLLESIEKDFDTRTYNSTKLKKALKQLQENRASYKDVNDYAVEIGRILSDVFKKHVTVDKLPDGRMYFNIAERILNPTINKNYDLIIGYASDVQTQLNNGANIRIRPQVPEINQGRIDGIINKIANEADFENVKWLLEEPIINLSQSIVDEIIQANVNFHYSAGLKPKITRVVSGHKPCDWCKNLAGTYEYNEAPREIYQRHDRCRCTVEYVPGDGRRQDVWSKDWNTN